MLLKKERVQTRPSRPRIDKSWGHRPTTQSPWRWILCKDKAAGLVAAGDCSFEITVEQKYVLKLQNIALQGGETSSYQIITSSVDGRCRFLKNGGDLPAGGEAIDLANLAAQATTGLSRVLQSWKGLSIPRLED